MTLSTHRPSRHSASLVRRNGQHQRPTKTFLKTYWPYLPLFSLGIGGILVAAAWTLGTPGVMLGVGSLVLAGISFIF